MPLTPAAPRTNSAGPSRSALALGVALLFLAGCAQLPQPVERVALKTERNFASQAAFAAPAAAWPADRWWSAYGDTQLDALIDEALASAPDMAAAGARLHRALALGQVVGSAAQPQVSANASLSEQRLSYNYLTPRSMTPQGWNDYGRATIDFGWDLDFWGRNRAAVAAASSERAAAEAELAQARLTLSAGIAGAYAELHRLFTARDVAQQSVMLRGKTAALFAERHANGLETRGSVRAADAQHAAAEGALLQLDELIGLQRHRIAALMGAGPDRGRAIARPTLRLDRNYGLPAELSANLLGRRPDVVAARLRAEAQARRIDQKQADFYPNVNLSAFIGLQSLGLDLLGRSGSTVGGVGPAISLPIFSAGRLEGELRGAQAAYAEAAAGYHATVSRALQSVADTALSQQALGERLRKSEQAHAAATEAHRVARNRYEGGLASYLEVLVAEDALLGSLNALTELRARSLTLDIALNHALGGAYQPAQP